MTAPLACLPRSEEALIVAIMRRDPEHAPIYHRRDLNGDGIPETMCNWFVRDVCADLGCPIPNLRANDQLLWLGGTLGVLEGWRVTKDIEVCKAWAGAGKIVVVGWFNPKGHPGHIAVMRDREGNIAQAGRKNFNKGTIAEGFGELAVSFLIHE